MRERSTPVAGMRFGRMPGRMRRPRIAAYARCSGRPRRKSCGWRSATVEPRPVHWLLRVSATDWSSMRAHEVDEGLTLAPGGWKACAADSRAAPGAAPIGLKPEQLCQPITCTP
ncbi:hypothetical protein Sviol_50620 [Streptomyces violascens]|uniref:Uncharacterized protein n=1 Tax=Streptomyces violascens TaxID=67381 RepID=A0ABQ3QTW4_9ACTN|nr:hypothetical protein Sviol_50620 [Streptomyces violascens]